MVLHKQLILLLSFLLLVAVQAKKKTSEWDELENLLNNLDEIGKKTFTKDEDEWEAQEVQDPKQTGVQNPCATHVCGWGKECMVTKQGKPQCECIRECPSIPDPDPFDKVCSNQNETFGSLCDLYRERCMCKRNLPGCMEERHNRAHLEYLGVCKELDPCTTEMMAQFPARMADWLFQVMKDLKKRQELHGDNWLNMLDEAENDDTLRHVYPVIWKFCDLDKKPHDKSVNHQELIPITAPVMPMESCIKPFLEKCDTDNDGKISLQEWGKCLGLNHADIIEKC